MGENRLLAASHRKTVEAFVAEAKKRLSENLVDILMYGSVARGTAGPESDIDLIIIVQDNPVEAQMSLSALAFDIMLQTGEYVSPQVMQPGDLKRDTIFLHNVREEAVHVL
ncbi:MAG: nucleotidyltransferase domain-containing protein [Thermoplasmatota archaeon]